MLRSHVKQKEKKDMVLLWALVFYKHILFNIFFNIFFISVIDCGIPPYLDHGNVSYVSSKLNNVAIYTCNYGYRLEGSQHRTCLLSGHWSSEFIVCVGKCCIVVTGSYFIHVFIFLPLLTLSQTTNFRLLQIERVCRRQF